MREQFCRLLAGFVMLSVLSAGLLETAEAAHGHAEGSTDSFAAAPDKNPESPGADGCDSSCHAAGHLIGLVRHGAFTLPAARNAALDAHEARRAGRDSPPPTPPPNI